MCYGGFVAVATVLGSATRSTSQHALAGAFPDWMASPSPPSPEISQQEMVAEALLHADPLPQIANQGGGGHDHGCNGTVAYLFLTQEEVPLAEAWREYLQGCQPGSAGQLGRRTHTYGIFGAGRGWLRGTPPGGAAARCACSAEAAAAPPLHFCFCYIIHFFF